MLVEKKLFSVKYQRLTMTFSLGSPTRRWLFSAGQAGTTSRMQIYLMPPIHTSRCALQVTAGIWRDIEQKFSSNGHGRALLHSHGTMRASRSPFLNMSLLCYWWGFHILTGDALRRFSTFIIVMNFWKQTFNFHIKSNNYSAACHYYQFVVYDHDTASQDDFLGQFCVPVSMLKSGTRVVPLFNAEGKYVRNNTSCAVLLVHVDYNGLKHLHANKVSK